MATITLRVCDLCEGQGGEATPWEIGGPGGRRSIDLCDKHAEPLTALYDRATRVTPSTTTRKARRTKSGNSVRGMRVLTVDEIEAMKKG